MKLGALDHGIDDQDQRLLFGVGELIDLAHELVQLGEGVRFIQPIVIGGGSAAPQLVGVVV